MPARMPSPEPTPARRSPPKAPTKRRQRARATHFPVRAMRSLEAEFADADRLENAKAQLAEAKGEARFKRMQACFTLPSAALPAQALNVLQQVALEL